MAALSQVPVTIITGFLGAGKTSLLNHLLTGDHGLKLAVLVNDFGAVNIDAELIKNRDGEVVSLENGCICCSLADGLLATAMRLLRAPEPPQHIIIETSGVSDPFEVANTFADPELQPHAPLDGIVTLVDCEGAVALDGGAAALARRQVAAADIVLLNKTDLIDTAERQLARNWIRTISPNVRILETQQGRAPAEMILGIGGTEVSPGSVEHVHHVAAFDTFTFESDTPLPVQRLHSVLQGLPTTIFRAKGFLYLQERPELCCILQSTGRRAMVTLGDRWGDSVPRNRIVFIGERGGIDEVLLQSRLDGDGARAHA